MRIYKIVNVKNGKLYVGMTKDKLPEKFRSLCARLLVDQVHHPATKHIRRAIAEYGYHNFKIELIDQRPNKQESVPVVESWVRLTRSNDPDYGYNLNGVEGGSVLRHKHFVSNFKPPNIVNLGCGDCFLVMCGMATLSWMVAVGTVII